MNKVMWLGTMALVFCSLAAGAHSQTKEKPTMNLKALRNVRRVLFLGDSITYAGGYIEAIDAALFLHASDSRTELINLGLPSETVSGLTEPNHADGAFPRPDLHERLERALTKIQPDLVVACYGMNDGIYSPFDAARFAKFKAGIIWLRDTAQKSGAKVWLLTPPPFDPVPIVAQTLPEGKSAYPSGSPFAGYDGVLGKYSEWLLSQKRKGWNVIDIHTPLNVVLMEKRKTDAGFAFAGDGVHLNGLGQRLIAREILRAWGGKPEHLPEAETSDARETHIAALVHERQRLLTDAYLNEIGHKRPGMAKGIPVAEAEKRASEIEATIRTAVRKSP